MSRTFDPARVWRAFFAAEWRIIAFLVVVDILWAMAIGLRVELGWRPLIIPAGMTLLVVLRGYGFTIAARTCEYLFLSSAVSATLLIFSYVCLASSGPLADTMLLGVDRAMGVDWLAIRKAIETQPALVTVMRPLYESLSLQGLTVALLLSVRGRPEEMRELFRLFTIGCILCCLGAMALPAMGPFKLFGYEAEAPFLPALEKLLAGKDLTFRPGMLSGVITFPSFHTVLALTYPFVMRRNRELFWFFAVADGLMLFTVPFFGGHYVVDVLGGVVVFALSLGLVRLLEKSERRAQPAPELAHSLS